MMNMVNFTPKLMTGQELINGVHWLKKEFYSFNNFSKRIRKKEEMNFGILGDMISSHVLSKLEIRYSNF